MAEKKINGRTFKTAPMSAPQALPLYLDVIAILGPMSGRHALLKSANESKEGDAPTLADALFLDAAAAVISAAGSERITDVVRRTLDAVEIMRPSGYSKVDFEGDFYGDDAGDLFPVVKWALMEQFHGFFPGSSASGPLATIRKALLS